MKCRTILRQGRRAAMVTCTLLIGAAMMQSCQDDNLLTGQPSWLGNSIYERLQDEGNYSYTLRLIDDLDQTEVMSHTGSRTLFAADDAAYEEWFKNNSWGVKKYEDLTQAQKRLLLKSAMINNAYLIELLSNIKGEAGSSPQPGLCMRRESSSDEYDSVSVMRWQDMPQTADWDQYREAHKDIRIMMDNTKVPMIHFLPKFMETHRITAADLDILTNHQASSIQEAWVNGIQVLERDITCKNGYVQKVASVMQSSPNMAQILREHENTSIWSELVDRFSVAEYNEAISKKYNLDNGTNDSVFILRYYSDRANTGTKSGYKRLPTATKDVNYSLKFDPGWNQLIYTDGDMHRDAAVMFVPSNKAFTDWWNGSGRELQDEYGTWDNIPMKTLSKLISVNMQDAFTETVPSKFGSVLNDAKDRLGITPQDVDSCFMGCNGVVYVTNKLFTPAEFASVAYPALAHQSLMNIIYWGIETPYSENVAPKKQTILPYLLSMDTEYSLLLPTNEAMKKFVDPAYYGRTLGEGGVEYPVAFEFYYDETQSSDNKKVIGHRYNAMVDASGRLQVGDVFEDAPIVETRNLVDLLMMDLLDQIVVVGGFDNGYDYYKTKGGSLLRVVRNGGKVTGVQGGWQIEHNHVIPVTEVYTKENGKSYQLEEMPPMGATKSLYMTLKEHPEYKGFLDLLNNGYNNMFINSLQGVGASYKPGNHYSNNMNMSLFDNYNYTVYVPTTQSIKKLQDAGKLPTASDLNENAIDSLCLAEGWFVGATSETDSANVRNKVNTCIKDIVGGFVRYHVQDNSVAIGMAPETAADSDTPLNLYESMKRDPITGRYYTITVNYDKSSMTIKDVKGHTRHVVTTPGLYNNIVREYWFNVPELTLGNTTYESWETATLFQASDAVVHLIDEPLLYEDMKNWRTVVDQYLKDHK